MIWGSFNLHIETSKPTARLWGDPVEAKSFQKTTKVSHGTPIHTKHVGVMEWVSQPHPMKVCLLGVSQEKNAQAKMNHVLL